MPKQYGPGDAATAFGNIGMAALKGREINEAREARNETRAQNRAIAKQRQAEGAFRLKEMGRADSLASATQGQKESAMQAQLQTMQVQQQQLAAKTTQTASFQAFQNFMGSSDTVEGVKSLNYFLQGNKDNPRVRNMFGHPEHGQTVRVDKLGDMEATRVEAHLRSLKGVTPGTMETMDELDGELDGQFDLEKINKRYILSTYADGTQDIVDTLALAAATGYDKWASGEQRAQLIELSKMESKKGGEARTAMQRNASAVAQAKDRIAQGQGSSADRELVSFGEASLGGTGAGKLSIASNAGDKWAEEGFQDLSFQDLQSNPEARKLIKRIELSSGISPADQKEIRELSAIVALAGPATGLSSEQTGFWDKMTNNLSNYISDDVTEAKAKSAYGALMNQVRNNLFGATLTSGEIKAFNDAYGTRNAGQGTVLAGLSTALRQVQAKLQTIKGFNNPAVIKFRTGKTMEELDQVMQTIDIKLAMYESVRVGEETPESAVAKIRQSQEEERPKGFSQAEVDNALWGN